MIPDLETLEEYEKYLHRQPPGEIVGETCSLINDPLARWLRHCYPGNVQVSSKFILVRAQTYAHTPLTCELYRQTDAIGVVRPVTAATALQHLRNARERVRAAV